MEKLPNERIQKLLKDIVQHFDVEDRSVRERQIRQWRQLKFYWDGFTNIWWNDIAHDWRVWDQNVYNQQYGDATYYDKRVNVFKAYLESIIAALSVAIPNIKCLPDDAENPLDLSTAKAGDKIAELISRHNDFQLIWLHALYIYCTEGLVAGYSYVKSDEKYGTYVEKEYAEDKKEGYFCPNCQNELDPALIEGEAAVADEYDPREPVSCPSCIQPIDPLLQKTELLIPRLVGETTHPKSRVCLEVYGGLFVKVPVYAMKQEDCPYLMFSYECHYAQVRARYPHLRDKFGEGKIGPASGGVFDPYERWGRLSTQYLGEYPTNTITTRNTWLRTDAFDVLDKDDSEELCKLYPNGCKVVLINDEFAEVCDEKLDDHWTLLKNPLTDYVHHQPLGALLTSVQDITNELVSLVLQTIEHGIPQTFADPNVLNFDGYNQTEVAPGAIFPATPKAGKTVGEAFYEVKTATLSQEVLPFGQEIQQLGQLASGALPSLFGGSQPNSSKTAAQYSMSKNQAMQRLQTPWKTFGVWQKELFGKAIPAYMKEMVEDERFVKLDNTGNYINVFIRKAELEGKIGDIELEAAENLPITWMQKKDTLMQFMQAANPVVMEALISPENLPVVAEAVGLGNLELPGEDDRQKQLEEITQLVNSTPFNMMGVDELAEPSVNIEPDVDDHLIHIQLCRNWLKSETGRMAKVENVEGYKNVLLHLKQHIMFVQMQQQMQAMQQQAQNPEGNPDEKGGSGKPQNDKTAAPVKGQVNNG